MAELVQLDKAAALVGKSEVTLRRLIKAGKIPFEKEKTLTGFIYLVDPSQVRKFYNIREETLKDPETPNVEIPTTPPRTGIRLAVAGESGNASEYWQKKSDMYEEKYHSEMVKHAHTREELGVWRGRAEQTQAMLMKLLPAPQEVEVRKPEAAPTVTTSSSSIGTTIIVVVLSLLAVAAVGAAFYLRSL